LARFFDKFKEELCMNRLVIGITGATGAIYGIRLLEALKTLQVESHLVVSDWGKKTILTETSYSLEQVRSLADHYYDLNNQAANISSGSFRHDGMVIAPCSMKTLAGISNGFASDLIVRAADVTLKEKRKLVLLCRETPLNHIHLQNMVTASLAGATIMPPVPAFYNHPKTIDDLVNNTVSRVLDQLGVDNELMERWKGL
jgi:polyprenyl P-hydroxybenzoate/phenylacrylic acid decarboxylase-like protein